MNVTLKQLEAFLAVARLGSFSAAAKALHVSQPALTALVQNLEAQLGAQLFERSSRGATMTTKGRELRPTVETMLNALNETLAGIMHSTSPRGGLVTLACIPSAAALTMPPLIAEFQRLMPQVKIEMRDAMVENRGILDMLRDNAIDFGVASANASGEFQFKHLFEDELVALVPVDHRLANEMNITWADLVGEQLIGMSENSYVRQLIDSAFAKIGVSKHPSAEVSLITTAIGMVKFGFGVSVLPDSAAQVCNLDGVKVLRLHDPVIRRSLGLLYRSMTTLSPAAKAFMRFMEERVHRAKNGAR